MKRVFFDPCYCVICLFSIIYDVFVLKTFDDVLVYDFYPLGDYFTSVSDSLVISKDAIF